ncbi:DUF4296 domain-containing protein [Fulvivirga sediminis]|uniref:DUF4296 domain-containing protein n=1 Tax=Fulvivirga sediminis TaxID=2803949 RepID=A0A937F8F7_9BACT|nr:DUF4296 domain-containing protein [Fulvivirga sediminis]MBL3656194.1 DUF4296 domain-containing protein [Fulvivirga sediminis]
MKTKIFIICYLFLVGCSSSDDVPEGILHKDEMISIMLDMYLAEGKVNNLRITRDSSLAIFNAYEKALYDKHKVSDSVYRESLTYYYDHPIQLEMVYESVLDSLNLKQERLKQKKEEGDKPKEKEGEAVEKDEEKDKNKE